MLQTSTLLVMCFMMTLNLQAVGSAKSQDTQQFPVFKMVSTGTPSETPADPAFERLAVLKYLPAAIFNTAFRLPLSNMRGGRRSR
jgi:hypothetical protein